MLLRWDVVEPYQIIKDKKIFIKYTMYLVLPSYNTFNLFTLYRCDKAIHMCNHIFIYFSFFLSVLQCFKQQY